MRVGVRVALGFASVLALTAFVGGIGWKGLDDYSGSVDQTQRMKQVGDALMTAAVDAGRYHVSQDLAAADSARRALDRGRDILKDSAGFEQALPAIADYRGGIDRFVAIDAENRARLGQMAEKLRKVEESAGAIVGVNDLRYAMLVGELAQSERDQKKQVEISDLLNAVMRSYLAARASGAYFEADRTPELAKNVQAALDECAAAAEELWDAVMLSPLADPADALSQAVSVYKSAFEAFAGAAPEAAAGAMTGLRGARKAVEEQAAAFDAAAREQQVKTIEAGVQAREAVNAAVAARGGSQQLIALANALDAASQRMITEHGAAAPVEKARAIAATILEMTATFPALEDEASRAALQTVGTVIKEFVGLVEAVVSALRERGQAIAAMNAARDTALAVVEAASGAQVDRMREGRDFSTAMIWSVTGLCLVIGVALAFVIGRGVSRPIRQMTAAMRRLADADLTVEVPGRSRSDEMGEMASAVQVFKENAEAMRHLEAQQDQERRRAEEEKRQALLKLADDFEQGVRGVVDAVSASSAGMRTSAESLSDVAERVATQSINVSAATEQSSQNVATAATATEEMSSSIGEIGRQVREASKVAGDAVARAAATTQAMRGLAEDAQKIGEVVGMITDIAGQTNLLALNATIEAARAGDAGKGFAVVAAEVKSLANQTAKATEDIAARVSAIQSATGNAVEAIDGIGKVIGTVNEIATAIAGAVEEQGAATQEISRNVQEASQGARTVAESVAGMNADAGEAGRAAKQVLSASIELSRQSEALRGDVDRFVASVRAG